MQLNSVSSYKYNNSGQNPNFKGIARVSNVMMNDMAVSVKYPKYRSIIDRAVKFLKDPENKDIDFVKKIWAAMEPCSSSKMLKRTGTYMVSGKDAQALEDAAIDIKFYGDMSAYKDAKSDFINDPKRHIKAGGIEQEIFVKSHLDNKKRIIIDEVGLKDKGQSMRSYDASKKIIPPPKYEPKRPSLKLDRPIENIPVSKTPDWHAIPQPNNNVANATLIDAKGQYLLKF